MDDVKSMRKGFSDAPREVIYVAEYDYEATFNPWGITREDVDVTNNTIMLGLASLKPFGMG